MVIDLILDRKEGTWYDAKYFFDEVSEYYRVFNDVESIENILDAMDNGTNNDVQNALVRYIDEQGYNDNIKSWIRKQDWLNSDRVHKVDTIDGHRVEVNVSYNARKYTYEMMLSVDSIGYSVYFQSEDEMKKEIKSFFDSDSSQSYYKDDNFATEVIGWILS